MTSSQTTTQVPGFSQKTINKIKILISNFLEIDFMIKAKDENPRRFDFKRKLKMYK